MCLWFINLVFTSDHNLIINPLLLTDTCYKLPIKIFPNHFYHLLVTVRDTYERLYGTTHVIHEMQCLLRFFKRQMAFMVHRDMIAKF